MAKLWLVGRTDTTRNEYLEMVVSAGTREQVLSINPNNGKVIELYKDGSGYYCAGWTDPEHLTIECIGASVHTSNRLILTSWNEGENGTPSPPYTKGGVQDTITNLYLVDRGFCIYYSFNKVLIACDSLESTTATSLLNEMLGINWYQERFAYIECVGTTNIHGIVLASYGAGS